jgi:hypothetical protein
MYVLKTTLRKLLEACTSGFTFFGVGFKVFIIIALYIVTYIISTYNPS